MDKRHEIILYHGSDVEDLRQLRPGGYEHTSAHRQGIYCSGNIGTASMYGTVVYTVKGLGEPNFVLDCDMPLTHQNGKIEKAFLQALMFNI